MASDATVAGRRAGGPPAGIRLRRRSAAGGAVLLVSLLPACRGPERLEPGSEGYRKAQREVELAFQEVLEAAGRKDFDRLEGLHLYGPRFSKWESRSPERLDAEEARRGERAGIEPLDSFKATPEGQKVDVFGRTAVSTFVMAYEAAAGGRTTAARVRATIVWFKDGSTWKIVHEHFSPVPPAPR